MPSSQVAQAVAPAAAYLPEVQTVQAVAAEEGAVEPEIQATQAELPETAAIVPAAQATQADASNGAAVPRGHREQPLASAWDDCPALQGEQLEEARRA